MQCWLWPWVSVWPSLSGRRRTDKLTVSAGDSLWKISQRYGVTVVGIQLTNGLSSDLILAGQCLELPALHTVKRGDTLYLLARQCGTSVEAIMKANGLTGSLIFVGRS